MPGAGTLGLHSCWAYKTPAAHNAGGANAEKKRKEKTTPFGVNLKRSQVLYRAAQGEQMQTVGQVASPATSVIKEECARSSLHGTKVGGRDVCL